MAKQVSNVFLAAKQPTKNYTAGAILIGGREAVKQTTGEVFKVAIFDDGAEVLVPNDKKTGQPWQPYGYDIVIGGKYEAGYIPSKKYADKSQFVFRPVQ